MVHMQKVYVLEAKIKVNTLKEVLMYHIKHQILMEMQEIHNTLLVLALIITALRTLLK